MTKIVEAIIGMVAYAIVTIWVIVGAVNGDPRKVLIALIVAFTWGVIFRIMAEES